MVWSHISELLVSKWATIPSMTKQQIGLIPKYSYMRNMCTIGNVYCKHQVTLCMTIGKVVRSSNLSYALILKLFSSYVYFSHCIHFFNNIYRLLNVYLRPIIIRCCHYLCGEFQFHLKQMTFSSNKWHLPIMCGAHGC